MRFHRLCKTSPVTLSRDTPEQLYKQPNYCTTMKINILSIYYAWTNYCRKIGLIIIYLNTKWTWNRGLTDPFKTQSQLFSPFSESEARSHLDSVLRLAVGCTRRSTGNTGKLDTFYIGQSQGDIPSPPATGRAGRADAPIKISTARSNKAGSLKLYM